jgi:hypothetical protein
MNLARAIASFSAAMRLKLLGVRCGRSNRSLTATMKILFAKKAPNVM